MDASKYSLWYYWKTSQFPRPLTAREKPCTCIFYFKKSCKHERGQILHLQHHINQIIICSGKKTQDETHSEMPAAADPLLTLRCSSVRSCLMTRKKVSRIGYYDHYFSWKTIKVFCAAQIYREWWACIFLKCRFKGWMWHNFTYGPVIFSYIHGTYVMRFNMLAVLDRVSFTSEILSRSLLRKPRSFEKCKHWLK